MADIFEKVHIEMDNISKVLTELEKVKDKLDKEIVILAGIGSFLQNIYTGIENILKQILLHIGCNIPQSSSWHKDLLNIAVDQGLISNVTMEKIGKYLYFRHFFMHAYGFMLDENKLLPLANSIFVDYADFKAEIDFFLKQLQK